MQSNEITSKTSQFIQGLMSQSFPTGYIPLGNPGENFYERANPGHPGNFFLSNSLPRSKNGGRIPGGRAKFSQTEETAPY